MGLVEAWFLRPLAWHTGAVSPNSPKRAGGQLWAKPGLAQVDPGGAMVTKGHAHRGFQRGDLLVKRAMSCVSATTVAA
jgi:hypothetical protein